MAIDDVKFIPLSAEEKQATGMAMRVRIEGEIHAFGDVMFGIQVGAQDVESVVMLPDDAGLSGLLANAPAINDPVKLSVGESDFVDTGFMFNQAIV